jgi:hypothetical protein
MNQGGFTMRRRLMTLVVLATMAISLLTPSIASAGFSRPAPVHGSKPGAGTPIMCPDGAVYMPALVCAPTFPTR